VCRDHSSPARTRTGMVYANKNNFSRARVLQQSIRCRQRFGDDEPSPPACDARTVYLGWMSGSCRAGFTEALELSLRCQTSAARPMPSIPGTRRPGVRPARGDGGPQGRGTSLLDEGVEWLDASIRGHAARIATRMRRTHAAPGSALPGPDDLAGTEAQLTGGETAQDAGHAEGSPE